MSAHFDPHRLADRPFEWRRMALRRPELELGIAGRPQLQQRIVAAVVQIDAGQHLRMAAVERFGQPQHRREDANHPARPAPQLTVAVVVSFRRPAPVISGDQRHHLDLGRIEAAQISVRDQVVGMLVVIFVADMHADVMQQRGVFEPFARLVGEPVDAPGFVEQRQREPGHLVGMVRPIVAPFGELDHAAAPDVRISFGLGNLLAVACDVVEHQPFAQRQVAQGQLGGAKAAQDGVEQD